MGDGAFDQQAPERLGDRPVQAGLGRVLKHIGDDLFDASLVAHHAAVGLDPRGGVHVAEAAGKQRDQFLIDAKPLTKTSGQPFTIAELEAAIEAMAE